MGIPPLSTRQIFYCVLYTFISITAIGGNSIVIFLIFRFRQMRTVTNVFIMNLAIGDLLMAILCIPFTPTANLLFYAWPFGSLMCRVVCYAQAVSVFISAYTMVAISIDRYIAIIYPLRPKMTRRHSYYLIALIWLVSLLTPMPTVVLSRLVKKSNLMPVNQTTTNVTSSNTNNLTENIGEQFNSNITFSTEMLDSTAINQSVQDLVSSEANVVLDEYVCIEDWAEMDHQTYYSFMLMLLQYLLPFSVLVFTYSRIALVVWGKQTPGEAHGKRDAKIAASKRKMIKMMITCVATFTLCWLPFNIYILFSDEFNKYKHIEYIWFVCHWLAMSHASYNPFIYIWMNSRFRSGFQYVLHCCFPCCRSNSSKNDLSKLKSDKHKLGYKKSNNCQTSIELTCIEQTSVMPNCTKTSVIKPESINVNSKKCSKKIKFSHCNDQNNNHNSEKRNEKLSFDLRRCKVITSQSCSNDVDKDIVQVDQLSQKSPVN